MTSPRLTLCLSATAVLCLLSSAPTLAQGSMKGTFFTLPANHPDENRGTQDSANVTGLVESFLGPSGLPVRSAKGKTYPGPTPPLGSSGPITDVNAQNEVLWWSNTSTITNHAVFEKTQNDAVPFNFTNFVPDGQTSDNPLLLAVHYQGTFTSIAGQTVTFTNTADDDLYGYLDGTLFIDEGGVVHRAIATSTFTSLSPGQHLLDLFYVDREKGGASLAFTSNVTLSPTAAPEPSAAVFLVSGFSVAFGFKRRRRAHTLSHE